MSLSWEPLKGNTLEHEKWETWDEHMNSYESDEDGFFSENDSDLFEDVQYTSWKPIDCDNHNENPACIEYASRQCCYCAEYFCGNCWKVTHYSEEQLRECRYRHCMINGELLCNCQENNCYFCRLENHLEHHDNAWDILPPDIRNCGFCRQKRNEDREELATGPVPREYFQLVKNIRLLSAT